MKILEGREGRKSGRNVGGVLYGCSGGGGKGCIKGCGQAEDKGAERIVSVRKSGKGCGAGGGIEEDGEVGRAAEGEGDAVAVEGGRVVKHAHAFR